jgi:hypothetical protein
VPSVLRPRMPRTRGWRIPASSDVPKLRRERAGEGLPRHGADIFIDVSLPCSFVLTWDQKMQRPTRSISEGYPNARPDVGSDLCSPPLQGECRRFDPVSAHHPFQLLSRIHLSFLRKFCRTRGSHPAPSRSSANRRDDPQEGHRWVSFDDQNPIRGGIEVPATVWFPHAKPQLHLREMKLYTDHYDSVVTLLALPRVATVWRLRGFDDDE